MSKGFLTFFKKYSWKSFFVWPIGGYFISGPSKCPNTKWDQSSYSAKAYGRKNRLKAKLFLLRSARRGKRGMFSESESQSKRFSQHPVSSFLRIHLDFIHHGNGDALYRPQILSIWHGFCSCKIERGKIIRVVAQLYFGEIR